MTQSYWLRILLYQDLPDLWVARSLEHDITAEGKTMDAAIDWILRIIHAHAEFDQRHGRPPLSGFPSAPQRYWNAFVGAAPLRTVTCRPTPQSGLSPREVLIAVTDERPQLTPRRPGFGTPGDLSDEAQASNSIIRPLIS
jgi:hypothetical protein